MNYMLDNADIEIACKSCNKKTSKTVGWIKQNTSFTCNCGSTINIDSSQFRSEIAKIEKSLKDLFK